jgi:inhibitor of KinA sporulation pathway (predicted exonuclease)
MEYYLCVLDFEATCWENSENKEQMEIIEFPSILYKITNNKHEYIGEFAQYVKPTINPKLTKFCTDLTGIQQETVDKANTIDNVYKEHIKWLNETIPSGSNLIFATCGNWDLKTQLPREIRNKKLKKNNYYSTYINVKAEFEYFYKRKANGMEGMLNFLKLKLEGRHHSGIDDARNISKIILKLIDDGHNYNQFQFLYVK